MRTTLVLLLITITGVSIASAQDAAFTGTVQPFLKKYCQQCHGAELSEGELRLDTLRADFVKRPAADHWGEVLDRINLGEMPPKDEPQPKADELSAVTDWISKQIQSVRHQNESTGGQVLLRRMTRLEYANTVQDLLHVEFIEGEGPIDLLPPDGSIRGFDRNSNALLVDPSLMQAYLEVASKIADRAIRFRPPLVPQRTVRFEYRDILDSAMSYQIQERNKYLVGDSLVIMHDAARSYSKLRHPFNDREVPVTGRYRVRVQAAAEPGSAGEPVYMRIKQGPDENIAQFRVDARPDAAQIYEFETIRDELLQGEYGVAIVDGPDFSTHVGSRGQSRRDADELQQQGHVEEATTVRARVRAQGDHAQGAFRPEYLTFHHVPKLYLDWIEVIGPLQGEYPPQSMKTIFADGWEPEKLNTDYARKIVTKLLPRVYRRRVTNKEVNEIVGIIGQELQLGSDFETAIKTGIVAMLCSPKFLYIYEPSAPNTAPRTLNQFELATRLSYFLWSSQPDETLFQAAVAKRLSSEQELNGQVDRMLADPRAEGFIQGFVRQWLKIDEFDRFPPDKSIFPDYYATELVGINNDVLEQPLAMVRELIAADESLLNLLDSDWTIVNERLANYYGIPGVQGDAFRRVQFNNKQDSDHDSAQPSVAAIRGGLLGMAGFHRWGSDGSRTKPVERGKYILDVFFNDPPPPPPPNAGEVEPNVQGENLTVGQRLAKHREQVTCNNCHRRIDPYGLALENFNVIGQWRTKLDGEKPIERWGNDRPDIEIGGTLPSGDTYDTFVAFKAELSKQEQRFLRGVTEKLLMYALARTIEPADRLLIDRAIATARENNNTMRSLIKAIVASKVFRQK